MHFINCLPDYFTTSSCSGRISIYFEDRIHCKGINWLLVKHCVVEFDEVTEVLISNASEKDLNLMYLKCEGLILHICCRDIDAGSRLLQIALSCGFRESGLIIGQKKTMLAIRTTSFSLETPLCDWNGNFLEKTFFKVLIDEANNKLRQNFARSDRFLLRLKFLFEWPCLKFIESSTPCRRWAHSLVNFGTDFYIFGGYGMSDSGVRNKRGQTSLLIHGNDANSISYEEVSSNDDLTDYVMHEAAVTGSLTSSNGELLSFLLRSGGRQSPSMSLPCVRSIHKVDFSRKNYLTNLSFNESNTAPCPRWGHSLNSLSASTFFLFGGRNEESVFEDAYVLTVEINVTGNDTVEYSELLLLWTRVIDPFSLCDCGLFGRFFHASCSLRDIMILEREVNLIAVHGGITSLNEPKSTDTAFIFDSSKMKFFPLRLGDRIEDELDNKAADLKATVLSSWSSNSVNRFAHTLTYLGKKTILLVGGTTVGASGSGSRELNNASFAIHLAFGNSGLYNAHYRQVKIFGSSSDKALGGLPCQECRCHHQTHGLLNSNRIQVVGGGLQTGMFGPHYCASLDMELCFERQLCSVRSIVPIAKPTTQNTKIDSTSRNRKTFLSFKKIDRFAKVIVVPKSRTKAVKMLFEKYGWFNKALKITSYKPSKDCKPESFQFSCDADTISLVQDHSNPFQDVHSLMGLPVTDDFLASLEGRNSALVDNVAILQELRDALLSELIVLDSQENDLGRQTFTDKSNLARDYLMQSITPFCSNEIDVKDANLDIPEKFEIVGDILMVPFDRIVGKQFQRLLQSSASDVSKLWKELAGIFGLNRVARKAAVDRGPMRESRVTILYPLDSYTDSSAGAWVTVVENSISFSFDISKVMFCSGNVTERMRMARQIAVEEVVVDLYCGVGYYTLPLLVHGRAGLVHACEWNPNSIAALRTNLNAAGVAAKCVVHEGDNMQTAPLLAGVADRVLLGLLPSSTKGWSLAANAIKPTGGIIHVHENVSSRILSTWVEETVQRFSELLVAKNLRVVCRHVEKVKSYAPRVYHIVLDLACEPNINF